MSGRDQGYYGPSDEDLAIGTLIMFGLGGIVSAVLIAVAFLA